MKEPTKKLLNLTRRYNKVRGDYDSAVRVYIDSALPMDADMFWGWVEQLGKEIRSQSEWVKRDAIESAVHNTLIKVRNLAPRSPYCDWLACAQFLQAYRHWSNTLHTACSDMPGVGKGDDGYGDWTDALPLAGKIVVERILNGDLLTYSKVDYAVKRNTPNLHDLIMEGENYIRMTLTDKVIALFACVVVQEDQRKVSNGY